MIFRSAVCGCLDRADDRRFERRIFLLEIQRDLRIGDALAQRPDERPAEQRDEGADGDDPEGDDRGRAEAKRFETGRRQQQREHRAGDDDNRAAQRDALPPPISDAPNDLDELGPVMVHVGPQERE